MPLSLDEKRELDAGRPSEGLAEQLGAIRVAQFRFILRAEEPMRLPAYAGSTLRGGFGHAFKRAVCVVRHGECDRCLIRQQCPYQYVFETPPPADTEMLRKYPAAPHPFVIEPPLDGRRSYAAGDSLNFGLTLIGRGIDYLPYFIVAFEEFGRTGLGRSHGRFRLAEVRGETRNGGPERWVTIYTGDRKILRDDFRIRTGGESAAYPTSKIEQGKSGRKDSSEAADLGSSICDVRSHSDHPTSKIEQGKSGRKDSSEAADLGSSTFDFRSLPQSADLGSSILDIRFLTPTRLKFENSLASDLEFHILIRNLLRRLSVLSYFHCGKRLDLDFKGLIERAKGVTKVESSLRWVDWERYSARQQSTMLMGGLVGAVTFEGPLAEFLPLLRLGELVHVGKGTVFGLGLYELGRAGPASKEEFTIQD